MSDTTRGLAMGGVTAVFAVVGTLLGNAFGAPQVWSISSGVIGSMVGYTLFRKR